MSREWCLPGETWKAVAGYEGLYEVSDFGRVRSLARVVMRGGSPLRKPAAIKKCAMDGSGYLQARMTKGDEKKLYRVNRLVAFAFVDNPDGLPEVNHRDLNKLNNAAHNLQWSTRAENMAHAGRRGRMCGYMNPNKRVKLTPEKVAQIRELSAAGLTNSEIAKQFGVSNGAIWGVVSGVNWNPEIKEIAPRLLAEDAAYAAECAP